MFPSKNAYLQFSAWAKEYGGIFSLVMGPSLIIVVSDPRIGRDLVDKKGGSMSDRPPSHIIDTVTDGKYLTFARYSSDWKTARTMLQKSLTKEACTVHQPILEAEATQLLYDMMKDPAQFFAHTERFSYSVATCILAGARSPRSTSPLLTSFSDMIHKWSGLLEPGSQPPVDLFPILKYVPEKWAQWKSLCREIRGKQFELYDGFVKMCEQRIKDDAKNGSLLEGVVEDHKLGNDKVLIRGTIGAFLEGATDTTSLFLKSTILMLTSSPEAQAKAHKELDAVVGSDRLPNLEDYEKLPYVQAIVKEVLRIRPMVPIGVPYYVTKEEVIDNYVIPKGSTVFLNQYGILHDTDAYESPELFNPDRFIESEFGTKPGVDPTGRNNTTHFGRGRRACVGQNLATNSIIINAMYFLWAFDFKAPLDPATKRRIPVDINNYSEGIATSPKPFKTDITPRSPAHAALIQKQIRELRPVFGRYEHELSAEEATYARSLGN